MEIYSSYFTISRRNQKVLNKKMNSKPIKNILTLLLLLISIITFGENIEESDLIGTWKVINLTGDFPPMPSEQHKQIDLLKVAFRESTFEFNADHSFSLKIDFNDFSDMMKNVHWKFNKEKSNVLIQEWKDKESAKSILLEIIIEQRNGKIIFVLPESPFELEVVKS
ncbi:hypothetical protein [Marinifilum fragile]|uniref:hypothetical protein n=1 Tax=Marinifilum fragile TaxID=570161 RepID=UPI002AA5F515|nr:hypothetical protein [Marinifilum fragile]